MKKLDRLLQRWRMAKVARCIKSPARVIDVGAHEGELFRHLGETLREGFGIEPLIETSDPAARFVVRRGSFPAIRPPGKEWDVITMLAVLEHIPRSSQPAVVEACFDLLRNGGLVVITVPSTAVDYVLGMLRFLRLVDGMSLEEHFGFRPTETREIFSPPRFRMIRHDRFQFGLNHLYVFEKAEPKEISGLFPFVK